MPDRWWLWWRPPCLLKRVIVNLASDRDVALRGALWASRGPWLTLKDVQLLGAGREPVRMDGEVVIHRSQVSFVQVLPD